MPSKQRITNTKARERKIAGMRILKEAYDKAEAEGTITIYKRGDSVYRQPEQGKR